MVPVMDQQLVFVYLSIEIPVLEMKDIHAVAHNPQHASMDVMLLMVNVMDNQQVFHQHILRLPHPHLHRVDFLAR